ncbi:MAG: hypothetical protein IT486_12035 [Gammaproteobacteria bacterium]|nr:hypothetical protein [Gammaproteobacteria bacterium]
MPGRREDMNAVQGFFGSCVRRLPALLAVAWLQLLLQPALALPMAPDMADCHHAGDCPVMTGADCTLDQPPITGADPHPGARHEPALLALLPADLDARQALARRGAEWRAPTTGPPLFIRFGHLRN